MFRSWRQSVRELGERVERLEGELGRLNMENADLKSQLKERGRPDCQARERARGITARWQAPSRTLLQGQAETGPEEARTQAGV